MWVGIQIFGQVEGVGVVVTHCPVVSLVSMVLGMNVLKSLDLPHLLAEVEWLSELNRSCGLWAVWFNVIQAYEAHQRAASLKPERVGDAHAPSE